MKKVKRSNANLKKVRKMLENYGLATDELDQTEIIKILDDYINSGKDLDADYKKSQEVVGIKELI